MTEDELAGLIAGAARESFGATQTKLGVDQIAGYALMSHDTADSCGAVVSSKAGLDAFQHGDPADFRFAPEEWDEFDRSSAFDEVNKEIGLVYEAGDYEIDPDWHEKFRNLVFGSCARALEILVHEGFFGSPNERDKIFVNLCVTDSETSETVAPSWAQRLNTPLVFESYSTWHKAFF